MTNQIRLKLRKQLANVKSHAGFSLVELLVVIAVIGIIAAIAIPNIAGITGQATTAKTQRNAQSIASVFASARAAGNPATYADADAAIDAVVSATGIQITTGSFNGSVYKVPLSAAEVTAVKTASPAMLVLTGAAGTSSLEYQTP
jgi:type IV pilus assembly protein PilA